jgi:hypothetical protein
MAEIPRPENTPPSVMFERAFRSLPVNRLATVLSATVTCRPEYMSLNFDEREITVSEILIDVMGVFTRSEEKTGLQRRVFPPLPYDEQASIVGNFLTSFNPSIHLLTATRNMDRPATYRYLDEVFEAQQRFKAADEIQYFGEIGEEELQRITEYNSTMQVPSTFTHTFAWESQEHGTRNKAIELVFFEETMKSLESIPLTRDQIVGIAALSINDACLILIGVERALDAKIKSKQKEPYYIPLLNSVKAFIRRRFNEDQFLDSDIDSILKKHLPDDVLEFIELEGDNPDPIPRGLKLANWQQVLGDEPISGSGAETIGYAKNPLSIKHASAMSQLIRDAFVNKKGTEKRAGFIEDLDGEPSPLTELLGLTETGRQDFSPASRLSAENEEFAISLAGIIFNQLLLGNMRRLSERTINPNSISDIEWYEFVTEAELEAIYAASSITYALQKRA